MSISKLTKYYLLKGYLKPSVFLLGDGRSGTTWFSELLNHDHHYWEMFEPFHGREPIPTENDRMYPLLSDLRTQENEPVSWSGYYKKIDCFHLLAPGRSLFSRDVLIKDISSFLVLDEIPLQEARKLLIVRNPFSVALSKSRVGIWNVEQDLDNLFSAVFGEASSSMKQAIEPLLSNKLLEYIAVWGLLHRLIIPKIESENYKVVFYELLFQSTETVLSEVLAFLGREEYGKQYAEKIFEKSKKPSRTANKGRIAGLNSDWLGELEEDVIAKAFQILGLLGVDFIYKDSPLPVVGQEELISHRF